jgi:hypothetical protein
MLLLIGTTLIALREVQCVLLQDIQRNDIECFLMGGAQKQSRCFTGLMGLMPPHCTKTPSITLL